MNGEIKYVTEEINRLVLLLRSCDSEEERQRHLDDINKNTAELERLTKK